MSSARLKTIRFLALLVMIAGALAIPFVLYYGVGSLISGGMHYTGAYGAKHLYVGAAKLAMLELMGGLLLCQVMIGGGGYVRWKCKKLLAAKTPATT